MTPEGRRHVMLSHEGQVLTMTASYGVEGAAEHTRCVVDGCFNALIRMEGPEAAAQYAFALADRVVGRVKEPTAFPVQRPGEPSTSKAVVDLESALRDGQDRLRVPKPVAAWWRRFDAIVARWLELIAIAVAAFLIQAPVWWALGFLAGMLVGGSR